MAKRRRKRNKSNLPQDVLERARQGAGVEEDAEAEVEEELEEEDSPEEAVKARPKRSRSARRRKTNAAPTGRRQRGELTHEMVEDILAHPTKFVTEEELKVEYQHVLYDLRNMGLLSAVLIVVLIVLNFLV